MDPSHPLAFVAQPDLLLGIVVLLGAWAALITVGVREVPGVVRSWRGEEARYRWALVAILALALALRFLVAPPTPEIRNRLGWAYAPDLGVGDDVIRKYGLGLPLLAKVLVLLFGRSEEVIFAANGLLGAASVLPAAGLARALAGSRVHGLCTAFVLAVTPLHVRFSAIDSPFIADNFATLLLFLAGARLAEAPRPAWFVVAVASAVTAAQFRVEAMLGPLLAVGLAAALGRRFPWGSRSTWLAVAATAVLLVPHVVMVFPQVLLETSYRYDAVPALFREGRPCWVVLNPAMQSWTLVALLPAGVLATRVPLPVTLWMLAGIAVDSVTDPSKCPTETAFSVARYQLQAIPFAALLGGIGLGELASRAALRPAAALAALVAFGEVFRLAASDTVLTREHAFLRAHLPDVPSPCRVRTVARNGDTTLFPPTYLSRLAGKDHAWVDFDGFVLDPGPSGRALASDCEVYYAAAQCSTVYEHDIHPTPPRHDVCEAWERAHALVPLATAEILPDPVGPMGGRALSMEPIPIGLYRVVEPPAP